MIVGALHAEAHGHSHGGPCLPAGTPIATANGARPIESVRSGDVVLSADPDTGEQSYQRVTRTFIRTCDELFRVETTDGCSVEATGAHLFWVEGKGFVAARNLARGDLLRDEKGRQVSLAGISSRPGRFTVYNFEVERTHTYFVGCGGWWVHNDCSDVAVGHFDKGGLGNGDIYRFEPEGWPENSPNGKWNFHDVYIDNEGMVYDSGRGHGPMPFEDWKGTLGKHWQEDALRPWGADEWNGWWDRELLRDRYGIARIRP